MDWKNKEICLFAQLSLVHSTLNMILTGGSLLLVLYSPWEKNLREDITVFNDWKNSKQKYLLL